MTAPFKAHKLTDIIQFKVTQITRILNPDMIMELNLQTRHIKVKGITPLLLCAMDMFAVKQIENKKK
jgi:hypothetical protein